MTFNHTPPTALLLLPDPVVEHLVKQVVTASGCSVITCTDRQSASQYLAERSPSLFVLAERLPEGSTLDWLEPVLRRNPAMPVLFYMEKKENATQQRVLEMGLVFTFSPPLLYQEMQQRVTAALRRGSQLQDWGQRHIRGNTDRLRQRLDELETMTRLGQTITSTLNLDDVLRAIVETAVDLTGSEEGSLLLMDTETGELYMRAGRNFQEDFVRTFRLPITDTLAGSVLRSGQPVVLDQNTPQKIKTSYLVHSLVYVPLKLCGTVIGVLGVDNRTGGMLDPDRTIKVLLALAEYAVIALQNAGIFSDMMAERNQLQAILANIQDGVLVIDLDERLILMNPLASEALGLEQNSSWLGRPILDVLEPEPLRQLVGGIGKNNSNHVDWTAEGGRVWSVQLTPIPEVGAAITMHDVSHLKKMDRIKSEFVHTVSHDLRSPLTAILGYVELIDRVGPVNEMQRNFIKRVQASVQNITRLVDDLVSLGQIEASFDLSRETVRMDQIARFVAEEMVDEFHAMNQTLNLVIPNELPVVLADPLQMRQLVSHLLDNAHKYTPDGGTITLAMEVDTNQLILVVQDTGVGIPSLDLLYVFEKFYRGANVSTETSGTGLGLAIVKSIVESHQGRVWVESPPGGGTRVAVVLPLARQS